MLAKSATRRGDPELTPPSWQQRTACFGLHRTPRQYRAIQLSHSCQCPPFGFPKHVPVGSPYLHACQRALTAPAAGRPSRMTHCKVVQRPCVSSILTDFVVPSSLCSLVMACVPVLWRSLGLYSMPGAPWRSNKTSSR